MPANTAVFSILSLADCTTLSQDEVGRRVTKLLDLHFHYFPLPQSSILPLSFLRQLFTHNKIEARFKWLFEHLNWQNEQNVNSTSLELQTLIKQMHWPKEAQVAFFRVHQDWMINEYVAIRPSFMSQETHGHFSLLHIRGEANIIESILQLWANLYQPHHLSQRWREWQTGIRIPAAIVIQRMIPSKSSGFAHIFFSPQLKQPTTSIYAVWGITTQQQRHKSTMDEFVINLHTDQIIAQHINLKKHEYTLQLDQLNKKAVPYEQQAVPSLTKQELIRLSELFKKIYLTMGKSTQQALEVEWAFDGKDFFLLHVQSKDIEQILPAQSTSLEQVSRYNHLGTALVPPKPRVKIYLFANSIAPTAPHDTSQLAGLCFQSDTWWLDQKIHPAALIHHGQAEYVKHQLIQTLRTFFQRQTHKEIWYQTHALTSAQLLTLDEGKNYEEEEMNPWMGYRGGLRNVHQFEVFDFELDVLSDLSKELNQPVQLLLPWVRSSTELHLIYKHITHAPTEQYHHLNIWLECSTPENLLNIHQYMAVPIAGIVINLDSLHALLSGLDPDGHNVLKYYTADILLLRSLLKAVAKRAALFHKPMILKTKSSSHQIMSMVEELEETGIMVPKSELSSTLQLLQIG